MGPMKRFSTIGAALSLVAACGGENAATTAGEAAPPSEAVSDNPAIDPETPCKLLTPADVEAVYPGVAFDQREDASLLADDAGVETGVCVYDAPSIAVSLTVAGWDSPETANDYLQFTVDSDDAPPEEIAGVGDRAVYQPQSDIGGAIRDGRYILSIDVSDIDAEDRAGAEREATLALIRAVGARL